MPPNLSWGDSRPYAVLQRTLDEDCRQAEEPKQLVNEASQFHLGASTNTLRSSALALCYSTAEYCAPVWSRCAYTSPVDVHLNSTMRHISGTLRSTPLPWLRVLSNNQACQFIAEIFSKICGLVKLEICAKNMRNMLRSHVRYKLACLIYRKLY